MNMENQNQLSLEESEKFQYFPILMKIKFCTPLLLLLLVWDFMHMICYFQNSSEK